MRKKLKWNPHHSMSEISKEYNMSRTSRRRVFKYGLEAKCFNFQRRQILSKATLARRLENQGSTRSCIATSYPLDQ